MTTEGGLIRVDGTAVYKWDAEADRILRETINAGYSYSVAARRINAAKGWRLTRSAAIARGRRIALGASPNIAGRAERAQRTRSDRAERARAAAKKTRPAIRVGAAPQPARPAPAPVAAPVAPPIATAPVSLWEARSDQCRYPLWADGDTHRDVCGSKVASEGESYCLGHMLRCFTVLPSSVVGGGSEHKRRLRTGDIRRRFNAERV